MTAPMFPYAVWQSGTTQNSIPANDNSLRNEIIAKAAQGVANAAPSSPAEGSVYVVGTPWGTFSTDDVVLFRSGTWYGFAPFTGWLKYHEVDDTLYLYDGGWSEFESGGGGGMTNPMTAEGDLIQGGELGEPVRIPIGDDGQVLTVLSGFPAWVDPPASEGETVTALATASGVVTINLALGDYFTLALTENVTSIVFSNLPGSGKGASVMIRITQGATARTVAWPASFRWEGAAPSVSTASGAVDVLALTTFDNGTKWDATFSKGRV